MEIFSKLKKFRGDKKSVTVVTLLGAAGMLLIMLSSLLPESEGKDSEVNQPSEYSSADYCADTEQRLEDFLKNIEGVGEVQVYLTVSSEKEYVYATEGRTSRSENKTEEEKSYVMIGGGSDKTALVETIKSPGISGAVVACTGCDSPVIQEKIYQAVSTALGIPTGKIYVTKLKGD